MAEDLPFSALPLDFGEDPRTRLRNPRLQPQPQVGPFSTYALEPLPAPYRGELKNVGPRPADPMTPLYEALSPAQGGYSMGELGATAWKAGQEGDWGKVGDLAPLIAAAVVPVPGAKGPKGVGVKGHQPRELDSLGYYSQALEAAKNLQRKAGLAQGWMNDLTKAGVKKAEIEATKLGEFFAANPNPTREQLVQHLRDNRVQVRETRYGQREPIGQQDFDAYRRAHGLTDQDRVTHDQIGAWKREDDLSGPIRWKRHGGQNLLLDPENPSNRESVVHQGPPQGTQERLDAVMAEMKAIEDAPRTPQNQLSDESGWVRLANERDRLREQIEKGTYHEPHFPNVPNYLFHLRTGQYKDAAGRPVLLGDEFQSTRAQTIRDSKTGPRDEAKIAELERRREVAREATRPENFNSLQGAERQAYYSLLHANGSFDRALSGAGSATNAAEVRQVLHAWRSDPQKIDLGNQMQTLGLVEAELNAMRDAPSGHPLVNDMSQTNLTGLRRLLQQAVDSGVEGIALTPGDLQNERYSLANHVQGLRYDPETRQLEYKPAETSPFERFRQHPVATGEWRAIGDKYAPEQLPGVVGKEMAQRLLAQPRDYRGTGYSVKGPHELVDIAGDIGGQGMREYYDRQYPAVLEKELKRLDPQWPGREQTRMPMPHTVDPDSYAYEIIGNGTPQRQALIIEPFHYFPLTPRIREEVAKGLPLFSAATLAALAAAQKPQEEPAENAPFEASPW